MLDAEDGFNTAMAKLEKRYGQSHLIAQSYIDSVTKGPAVKANDVEALVKLANAMSKCETVLNQLKFTSDLDSSGTLESIVDRFPDFMQAKWMEKVSKMLKKAVNQSLRI